MGTVEFGATVLRLGLLSCAWGCRAVFGARCSGSSATMGPILVDPSHEGAGALRFMGDTHLNSEKKVPPEMMVSRVSRVWYVGTP